MGEQITFNVFDQFGGCFVPYGLLALKKTSAGAKICYSLLAQQANARGVTQLNIALVATTLGESESSIIRYLQELEQLRLIESSRGNANAEDVRISFPRHPWLTGQASLSPVPIPVSDQSNNQAHLFAVEAAPSQASSVEQTATNVGSAINASSTSKSRRRRRRYGRPRSRHTYEDCLAFVTYQKEVQGRWWLYDLDRLAEFLYFTGQQDDDVSAYLSEVKNAA